MHDHAHRWRLPEPDGPMADARCECGATREFHNVWAGDRLSINEARTTILPTTRGGSTKGGYVTNKAERRFAR